MGFVWHNQNPEGFNVGDCTIRAISMATGQTWENTYADLALQGFIMRDMPSANHVWGVVLLAEDVDRNGLLRGRKKDGAGSSRLLRAHGQSVSGRWGRRQKQDRKVQAVYSRGLMRKTAGARAPAYFFAK